MLDTPEQAAEFLIRAAGRWTSRTGQVSPDLIRTVAAGGLMHEVYSEARRRSKLFPDRFGKLAEARKVIESSLVKV